MNKSKSEDSCKCIIDPDIEIDHNCDASSCTSVYHYRKGCRCSTQNLIHSSNDCDYCKSKSEDNWVDMGDFIVVKDVDLAEDLIGMTKPPESLKGKIIIIAPDGLEFVSIEDLKELPQVKSLISETEDRVREDFIHDIPHKDGCALYKGEQTDSCDCGVAEMQTYLVSLTNSEKGEE